MQVLNASSLTAHVNDWLANTRHPRILHVFDNACNLINENHDVLSVVAPQIGKGPFNVVVGENISFSEHLSVESSISILEDRLDISNLIIRLEHAKRWNPRPEWETLRQQKEEILTHVSHVPEIKYERPILLFSNSVLSTFYSSLAAADLSTAKSLASRLAGLGIGLTPSGDDLIMGAIYAIWILHPYQVASVLAHEIAETAAPLTTSLSAAWIRSAGRGEAGIVWHGFFDTLLARDDLEIPIARLLSVGETSGADALAGFFGVLSAFKECNPCLS